jgi:hypothetical protein
VLYLNEEAAAHSFAYIIRDGGLKLLRGEGEALSSVTAVLAVQSSVAEPPLTDAAVDELGMQLVSFSKDLESARETVKTRLGAARKS